MFRNYDTFFSFLENYSFHGYKLFSAKSTDVVPSRFPSTPLRDHPSTPLRDHPSTPLRDHPSTLLRDHPSTLLRDHPSTLLKGTVSAIAP